MKFGKIYILTLVVLFNLQVANAAVALPKYEKITDSYLVKQINDQGKKIDQLTLITSGFSESFKLIDNNLFQLIDLFITTNGLNQAYEKIFFQVDDLVAAYNILYKKYLYPAAKEEHISSGRTIEDLDENWIKLRKEVLDALAPELEKLVSKARTGHRDIKNKLESLQQMPEPVGVLRYKESIKVVNALNGLYEKLINKTYKALEQLKANRENKN